MIRQHVAQPFLSSYESALEDGDWWNSQSTNWAMMANWAGLENDERIPRGVLRGATLSNAAAMVVIALEA